VSSPAPLEDHSPDPRLGEGPRILLLDVEHADRLSRTKALEPERSGAGGGREGEFEGGEALSTPRLAMDEHDHAGGQQFGKDDALRRVVFCQKLRDGLDVGARAVRGARVDRLERPDLGEKGRGRLPIACAVDETLTQVEERALVSGVLEELDICPKLRRDRSLLLEDGEVGMSPGRVEQPDALELGRECDGIGHLARVV